MGRLDPADTDSIAGVDTPWAPEAVRMKQTETSPNAWASASVMSTASDRSNLSVLTAMVQRQLFSSGGASAASSVITDGGGDAGSETSLDRRSFAPSAATSSSHSWLSQ